MQVYPGRRAETRRETPDEVLVVAAILGDLGAFDDLASRYRPAVVRTAETVVGRHDAEDVAQDALLLAFKALPSIEDPARFAAWLMVITKHRALRFARQSGRDTVQYLPLDDVLRDNLSVLRQPPLHQPENEEVVQRALDQLPENYAMLMRLRYLDGMSLKRLAALTDTPLSTVKWRVQQGKKLMRAAVEKLEHLSEQWNET